MLFQDIDGVFSERIGASGLDQAEFDSFLPKAEQALDFLRKSYETGSLPLLGYPEKRDDLAQCKKAVARLREGAKDIVFLGTGGSSLGAQALAQIASWRDPGYMRGKMQGGPRFHFFDNLDGLSFARALTELDLETARFISISKSGSTAETMMQILSVLEVFRRNGAARRIPHQILGLSENTDNPQRRILAAEGVEILEHDPGVGGRFSVLTNVGMLPAIFLGLSPELVRMGAWGVLAPLVEGGVSAAGFAPALGAIANVALFEKKNINIAVMLAYSDRLERFSKWYAQLWAESLGKGGKGTTPVAALGPVDQHSQLQLYLDGPIDKLVTIMMSDVAGTGPRLAQDLDQDPEIGYLAGRTLGDLVDCEQRASAEALIRNGRPVRIMQVPVVDAHMLGQLFMHFMLETIIAGHIMGVDPFDQPAVEQGKILAREYLAKL